MVASHTWSQWPWHPDSAAADFSASPGELMAELLGYLLQHHLYFVGFSGFNAFENGHGIRDTNPHATVSDFP